MSWAPTKEDRQSAITPAGETSVVRSEPIPASATRMEKAPARPPQRRRMTNPSQADLLGLLEENDGQPFGDQPVSITEEVTRTQQQTVKRTITVGPTAKRIMKATSSETLLSAVLRVVSALVLLIFGIGCGSAAISFAVLMPDDYLPSSTIALVCGICCFAAAVSIGRWNPGRK